MTGKEDQAIRASKTQRLSKAGREQKRTSSVGPRRPGLDTALYWAAPRPLASNTHPPPLSPSRLWGIAALMLI